MASFTTGADADADAPPSLTARVIIFTARVVARPRLTREDDAAPRAASAFGAAAARDKGCPRPRAVVVVVARRIAEDDDVEVDIVTEVIISLALSRARACDEGDVHGGGRHVIEGCIGWLNPTGFA